MGVLLLLAVVALAFLCGRLQVTVNRLVKRQEQLELDVATVRSLAGIVSGSALSGVLDHESED